MAGVLQGLLLLPISSHLLLVQPPSSVSDSSVHPDCSPPGLPAPHHLLEFVQVHVHFISDAIQPPHPLSATSPPALNLSQHQDLLH